LSYQLVFTSPSEDTKAVGENVFFADLPTDYKVYAFYYPGALRDPGLEGRLRHLGEQAGKNLFVNIGALDDPQFKRVVSKFSITKYPVIAITAVASLASPTKDHVTTFARLDGKALLDSSEKTVECVQEVFNLFLQGKVADAIGKAKWTERKELLAALGHYFSDALKSLGKFISNHDISFSLTEGKLELKKSGD